MTATEVTGDESALAGTQTASRPVARRWIARGGFALADQGLISGSNFLINIVLARWLSPEQYGAFALVYAIFLLLTMLHQCLLLEPMAVFGGGTYRKRLRAYGSSLLWLHFTISLAVCAILLGAAAIAKYLGASGGLPGAIAGMGISAPCILLLWLARRACYIESRAGMAAGGAVLYCAFMLGGLWIMHASASISPFGAFVVMGAGALAAAVVLFLQLNAVIAPGEPGPSVAETWQRHWSYGFWALGGAIASWIPAYIYYPAAGRLIGLASAGDLRAVMNLAAPATQLQAAFSMLLIPYASRCFTDRGGQSALRLSRLLTWCGLGAALIYWLTIIAFERPVLHFMYGGKYDGLAALVPLAAAGSIFWTGTFGASTILRATDRPKLIFVGYTVSAAISLLAGLPATLWGGIKGAIWGINISDIAGFFLLLWLVSRANHLRRTTE